MSNLTKAEDFYDRLAPFFDVMNDWPRRLAYERPFWQNLFQSRHVRSVLDCACGTGWHVIQFVRWGYEAAGADVSEAMIVHACANAAQEGVDARFVRCSFAELGGRFSAPFDALICTGNSLPHVLAEDEVLDSLRGMASCLRSGGTLVIQNLNYDRRWRERPRFFALDSGELDGHEVLVWRMADYGAELITFHTALFEKGDGGRWSVRVNSTPQRPVFRHDLFRWLAEAGFGEMQAYGDFEGAPFDATSSGDLIVVARKVV